MLFKRCARSDRRTGRLLVIPDARDPCRCIGSCLVCHLIFVFDLFLNFFQLVASASGESVEGVRKALPQPTANQKQILEALGVNLPAM